MASDRNTGSLCTHRPHPSSQIRVNEVAVKLLEQGCPEMKLASSLIGWGLGIAIGELGEEVGQGKHSLHTDDACERRDRVRPGSRHQARAWPRAERLRQAQAVVTGRPVSLKLDKGWKSHLKRDMDGSAMM
jgi:hypothetical protein